MYSTTLTTFTLIASLTLTHAQSTTQACNNSPALCSRSYGNITHLGAHDSPFVSNAANKYTVSGNQFYDSPTQLSAGVRLLTAQIHTKNETGSQLRLCHSDCSLYDAGSLVDWLASIKKWLDGNPNDVVTIVLVNEENADAARLDADFRAAGISQYGYTRTPGSGAWPTLSSMISANTRLVAFVSPVTASSAAPYLLNQFDYTFENPFEVTAAASFSCLPDRPANLKSTSPSAAIASGSLFLMNHFLGKSQLFGLVAPDRDAAKQTNSPDTSVEGSLGQQLQTCTNMYGRQPSYVLVDWFNVGPAIAAVDTVNQVTGAVGRKEVGSAIPAAGSTASGDARQTRSGSLLGLVIAAVVWGTVLA